MKVAIVGATGRAGIRLTEEALSRGHEVVAIARGAASLGTRQNLTTAAVDLNDTDALASAMAGAEAVLYSYRAAEDLDRVAATAQVTKSALDAVKRAGIHRFLIVGGAGSLEVAPGQLNVDQPAFPEASKPTAVATMNIYKAAQDAPGLQTTYMCPTGKFFEGERTGTFRVGGTAILKDKDGQASISFEDFAVAMVDEMENPKHTGEKVAVGY
jgi:hypothetical protein